MTNNPTIDGVSRATIEKGFDVIEGFVVPTIKVSLPPCHVDDDESWNSRDAISGNIRALLDAGISASVAPAVERQEPAAFRFKWDYDHGNGWCRGAVRFVESMEEVDHEDKSTWREITPLYEAAPEVAALQSTIAQLQARIAELESGRGEAAGYLYACPEDEYQQPEIRLADFRVKIIAKGWIETPLYTAPPSPVAVDENAEFEKWAIAHYGVGADEELNLCNRDVKENKAGWMARACLDTTAALNEVKK